MERYTTIIIVDDELSIRQGIKTIMDWESEGFQVIAEAENGADALMKIKQQKPDIVLTDIKMPVMDGITLLNQMKEIAPETACLVLSSFDDFPTVSNSFKNGAVDYILKPTLTKSILLKHLNDIKQQQTQVQTNAPLETIETDLARYLAGFSKNPSTNLEEYFHEGPCFLMQTTRSFLPDHRTFHAFVAKGEAIVEIESLIAYAIDEQQFGVVIRLTNALARETVIKQFAQHTPALTMIASQFITDTTALQQAYQTITKEIDAQLFFCSKQQILKAEDFVAINDLKSLNATLFLKELVDHNYLESLTRIDAYFARLITSHVEPISMKQEANNIFYTLLSSIETHYDPRDFRTIKYEFLQKINSCVFAEDFQTYLSETLDKIKQLIAATAHAEDPILINIKEYIDTHYHEALSLADLAEKFHFNYHYLSVVLSSFLNMSFSEYLNKIRMNAAKELLLQQHLPLSEISKAVGYSDLSYFSKIFKKEFKISPSKYRREMNL